MRTIMFAPPILGFDRKDVEMRVARAAGWRRSDLWWERLQENAHIALAEGRERTAKKSFRLAYWLSRLAFSGDDPRRATSLANIAFAARLSGSESEADRLYRNARDIWINAPNQLENLEIKPRARSSLFHLRMEVKHRQAFRQNMEFRLRAFMRETDEVLEALSQNTPPPHRLFTRWRGEKPAVFDDTRKLLAACLLVASHVV